MAGFWQDEEVSQDKHQSPPSIFTIQAKKREEREEREEREREERSPWSCMTPMPSGGDELGGGGGLLLHRSGCGNDSAKKVSGFSMPLLQSNTYSNSTRASYDSDCD